jgi:hypothetical protein
MQTVYRGMIGTRKSVGKKLIKITYTEVKHIDVIYTRIVPLVSLAQLAKGKKSRP